jgi:hypothetical protein
VNARMARAVRSRLLDPTSSVDAAISAAVDAIEAPAADSRWQPKVDAVVDTEPGNKLLGPTSTQLSVKIQLRMAQVPTSICHLLDPTSNPLLTCRVVRAIGAGPIIRRLRITAQVEGYSAPAIDTVELDNNVPRDLDLLPTFFPERLHGVTELTRATVSVLIEDLDAHQVELHRTAAIWLLARTTALLAIKDPVTGGYKDLTPYFGAFVTPNDPQVLGFLSRVKNHHPDRCLEGYLGTPSNVSVQVQAAYDAVREEVDVTYVNSYIAFSPDDPGSVQRVRLPAESLADGCANCIDGVVLLASLLEAMSLHPAIVVVPGHAFLGWETWERSDQWEYLETTLLGTESFSVATARGSSEADHFERLAIEENDPRLFQRWPLRQLREEFGIMPMV